MTDPVTITDALRLRAASPRAMTFLDGSGEIERWTFAELGRIAGSVAGSWRELGVGPGDRVGLLGSTTPDLVAAIFGCWAAGAIAVPLAVPLRITSPEALLEEVQVRAGKASISVLAADPLAGAMLDLDGVAPEVIALGDLSRDRDPEPYADVTADDPALIQFTSGSTASPKGVVLSHGTLVGNGLAARDHVGFSSADVAVSWLPLYHDFGLIGLTLWPVVIDMSTYLIPPEVFIGAPKRWVEALSKYGATVTAAPNFAFGLASRALRRADEPLDLKPLRIAANGAEPVDPDTIQDFVDAAGPSGFRSEALLGVYGLAEATLGVSAPTPLDPPPPWWVDGPRLTDDGVAEPTDPGSPTARPLISVGQPLPGVEVAIRTEDGDPLPDGTVGEIWVRSDYAMLGYWDDPEETAQTLVDGWIRTGDLGVLGPHGLYITGRVKDMIIVGGRNLYPEDAERVTARIPGIRKGNAVAFGIISKAREGLVVMAETRLSGDDAMRLAKQVAAEVRQAMRVAADQVILLVPGSLPKTPSGKLQRRLTRSLHEAGDLVSNVVASIGRGGAPKPA